MSAYRITGIDERPEAVAPFTFEARLPLASRQTCRCDPYAQRADCSRYTAHQRYEALFIEGAGGVAVPLTDDLMVDLISELGIPP